jgi:hypothetical protein
MIKRWNRLKTEMMILRSDILTGKVRFSLGTDPSKASPISSDLRQLGSFSQTDLPSNEKAPALHPQKTRSISITNRTIRLRQIIMRIVTVTLLAFQLTALTSQKQPNAQPSVLNDSE